MSKTWYEKPVIKNGKNVWDGPKVKRIKCGVPKSNATKKKGWVHEQRDTA